MAIQKIQKNLFSIRKFSELDFHSNIKRDYLIRKLELLENDYFTRFLTDALDILKANYFVVLKGLPFDDNNKLSVAIASLIGTPIKHNNRVPGIVREISPREGPNPLENFPHTDSPHWPHPNDYITLQCTIEDQTGGGFSRIVSIDSVLDELNGKSHAVIDSLSQNEFPFLLDKDFGDKGWQIQPILNREKYAGRENYHVRLCRIDTENCIRKFHADIDPDYLEKMIFLEKQATKIGQKTQFPLTVGDWLIFDNRKTFHSKTPTSKNSVRILRKMKLNVDREKIYGDKFN